MHPQSEVSKVVEKNSDLFPLSKKNVEKSFKILFPTNKNVIIFITYAINVLFVSGAFFLKIVLSVQ